MNVNKFLLKSIGIDVPNNAISYYTQEAIVIVFCIVDTSNGHASTVTSTLTKHQIDKLRLVERLTGLLK